MIKKMNWVQVLIFTLALVQAKTNVKVSPDRNMALSPLEELKEAELRALTKQVNVTDQSLVLRDDDVKTELGKKLREHMDEILEKIKDAIEKGKDIKRDVLEKLKEIRQKLKDLKVDMGEKAKGLLQKIKDKAKDYWKKILD